MSAVLVDGPSAGAADVTYPCMVDAPAAAIGVVDAEP
jgi:hypothetical protein